eukprot:scaffold3043_cov360-Prasinococcus_capsulatus_cf.AAC.15
MARTSIRCRGSRSTGQSNVPRELWRQGEGGEGIKMWIIQADVMSAARRSHERRHRHRPSRRPAQPVPKPPRRSRDPLATLTLKIRSQGPAFRPCPHGLSAPASRVIHEIRPCLPRQRLAPRTAADCEARSKNV